MTKVAISPRTWAGIRRLKHAYAGTLLRTQLGFEKQKMQVFCNNG